MRLVVAIVCLSACSFTRNASQSGDGTPGDAAVDSKGDTGSGTPDAFVPPDACVDVDGDGVCDDVDNWLCGPAPTAPGATMNQTVPGMTLALTTIDVSGDGQVLMVAPGAPLALSFHYQLTETRCTGNCIDQIEVGFEPGGRTGCPYDHSVNKNNGASGNITNFAMTAPATPGVYSLSTNIGQNTGCTDNGDDHWWPDGTPPDPSWTIALVCVH